MVERPGWNAERGPLAPVPPHPGGDDHFFFSSFRRFSIRYS